MNTRLLFYACILFLAFACGGNKESIKPSISDISESVYASGSIKSLNQYQLFPTVSGVIKEIFVQEGQRVSKGQTLISIDNSIQRLNKENAELAARFYDYRANREKIEDAQKMIELSNDRMLTDSALYFRQKSLFQQKIGTVVELEQRELAYENSKNAYQSSIVRYNDLKRQLAFSSSQSKKSLEVSKEMEADFTLKSDIDGIIYSIYREKGELVGPQTPIAVLGDADVYVLEMQVDEYDIVKLKKDLVVLVTMDSYRGRVFEARVTKINPMINERSKTFTVEAGFVKRPEVLYPNISFEASIILHTKKKALLIPRAYLNADNTVNRADGEKVKVKTGLKDYHMVEILSGITAETELLLPEQ